MIYTIKVNGVVRPQGSMQLARDPRTGKGFARYSDRTVAWRQLLHGSLSTWWAGQPALQGPVEVTLLATFQRPKWHLGTGRNAGVIKAKAPTFHTSPPDADKCARAVGDSLVDAGVLHDDAQIAVWTIRKTWCAIDERPGALITVGELMP